MGYDHSCALFGDGTFTDSTLPVSVVGITDAVAAAVVGKFSCAVRNDGTVWLRGART